MIRYFDATESYEELHLELDNAYRRIMQSGRYVLGEELELFEREFAESCGAQFAVGVGNGFDALTIALRAAGVRAGDEVIVPAFTFGSTWLSVLAAGAVVVPAEVDPATLLIDPAAVDAACTSRTTAVVPVHLYGSPADMRRLERLASQRGLLLLSDAAQAHGAEFGNRHIGSFGTASAFSFYPSKNLAAFGDGGAISTNDYEVARKARRLRNYGVGTESKYEFLDLGVNSRLDPLQAAFLRVKLRVLTDWNQRRQRVAARYRPGLERLASVKQPPAPAPDVTPAWHIYCIQHENRERLRTQLWDLGIETEIHYPIPPHLMRAFAPLGFPEGSYPVAERASETVLSLPMGPHLDDIAVSSVIQGVIAAIDKIG